MHRGPSVALLLAAGLVVGSPGCAGGDRSLPPAVAAARAVETAPDRRALEALEALGLTPDQRAAINKLADELAVVLERSASARRTLVEAIVSGIAAGRMDPAVVDPAAAALVAATNAAKPDVLAGLDRLHALLTAQQRRDLLAGLGKHDKGKESAEERAKRIGEALDLSFSQKLELASTFRERMGSQKEKLETLKGQLEAARVAFERDDFAAAKLAVAQEPLVEFWLGQSLRMFDVLLPVLDDYQRRVLAEMASRMMSSGKRASAPAAVPAPSPPPSSAGQTPL